MPVNIAMMPIATSAIAIGSFRMFVPYYETGALLLVEEGENALTIADEKLTKAEDSGDEEEIAYWTLVLDYVKSAIGEC